MFKFKQYYSVEVAFFLIDDPQYGERWVAVFYGPSGEILAGTEIR